MQSLAVLEKRGDVTQLLREMLPAQHYTLVRMQPDAPLRCSLLVVAPDFDGIAAPSRCRILLTPSGKAAQLRAVHAEWVVSFGTAARESISFSSLHKDGLTLCVRRGLPTLSGRRLEPQDVPMPCRSAEAETMLAACAAVLLARGK